MPRIERTYNHKRQATGEIWSRRGGVWLEKKVVVGRHQLYKPPAWAIDEAHYKRLLALNARGVHLTDETGRHWFSELDDWTRYGFDLDRGEGVQRALTLDHWTDAPAY